MEDLCSDVLQQRFDSKESLKTFGQYKTAISDYLSNRSRWMTGKARLNWLGFPEGGDPAPTGEDDDEERMLANISGEINALVRNKFRVRASAKVAARTLARRPGPPELREPQQTWRCLMLRRITRARSATGAMNTGTSVMIAQYGKHGSLPEALSESRNHLKAEEKVGEEAKAKVG